MKKQKRTFFILLVLLVICLAAYLGIRLYNQKTEENEKKEAEAEKIVVAQINPDDVTAFSYQYEGNQLAFSKQDGTWICDNNTGFSLNQDAIQTMLSTLKELTAEDSINTSEEEEDSEDYGFSNPTMVLTVTSAEKTETFTFGMHNELTGQDYIKTDASDTVYLVATDVKTAFQKSLTDLKAVEASDTESVLSTESTENTGINKD